MANELKSRFARCAYFGKIKPNKRFVNDECNYGCKGNVICKCGSIPSSEKLAFFEYRGEGSQYALSQCHICGYYTKDWQRNKAGKNTYKDSIKINPHTCYSKGKECIFGPYEFDRFYCGCFGWD